MGSEKVSSRIIIDEGDEDEEEKWQSSYNRSIELDGEVKVVVLRKGTVNG